MDPVNRRDSSSGDPLLPRDLAAQREHELLSAIDLELVKSNPRILVSQLHSPTDIVGKSIVITCDQPGPYQALVDSIRLLQTDPRCSRITLLLSGTAAARVEQDLQFTEVPIVDGSPARSALALLTSHAVDTLVTTADGFRGWQAFCYVAAQRLIEVKHRCIFAESPDSNLGLPTLSSIASGADMNFADSVLCNDQTTRQAVSSLFHHPVEQLTRTKFIVTGSGLTDALRHIGRNKGPLRSEALTALGLHLESRAITFLGDMPEYDTGGEAKPSDNKTNRISLGALTMAVINLAKSEPERNIALLLRPHPRDKLSEPLLDEVIQSIADSGQENLLAKKAPASLYSRNQILAASHVIASTTRSTLFDAPFAGCLVPGQNYLSSFRRL